MITALLVALGMERTQRCPPYMSIYQLSKQVLGAKALQLAYGEKIPITTDVPTLASLVANHTPVRIRQLVVAERQQSLKKGVSANVCQASDALMTTQQDEMNVNTLSSQLLTGMLGWMTRSNNVLHQLGQAPGDHCNLQFLNQRANMLKPSGTNEALTRGTSCGSLPLWLMWCLKVAPQNKRVAQQLLPTRLPNDAAQVRPGVDAAGKAQAWLGGGGRRRSLPGFEGQGLFGQ